MRRVRFIYGEHHPEDSRVGAVIDTPFNQDFIDDLKSEIPARERAWDPDLKQWWVSEAFADQALGLVIFYYGETETVDEDGVVEYQTKDGVVSRQESML